MIKLNNRNKINKSKLRVGRGIGSGKGKTSGRGVKAVSYTHLTLPTKQPV